MGLRSEAESEVQGLSEGTNPQGMVAIARPKRPIARFLKMEPQKDRPRARASPIGAGEGLRRGRSDAIESKKHTIE